MKIAHVIPGRGDAPPRRHAATRTLVFDLAGALERRGHESAVFVETACEPTSPAGQALAAFLGQRDVDLVHLHIDDPLTPCELPSDVPVLISMRGSVDRCDDVAAGRCLRHTPCVAICNVQRFQRPWFDWRDTIRDGRPPERYPFRSDPDDYLAFVGPLNRAGRIDRALEIARRSGLPLRVLPLDEIDNRYIERLLSNADGFGRMGVDQIIDPNDKIELLAGARALLVPGNLPDPPDPTILEAMACGTPTLAFSGASGVELVSPGITGFVVDSVCDAVEVLDDVNVLNRNLCRSRFLRHFTIDRVADDYLAAYRDVLGSKTTDAVFIRTPHRPSEELPAMGWPQ